MISGELNETSSARNQECDHQTRSSSVVALVLWSALALLVAAAGLLWLRFGSQVFLDAASTVWKSCF